MHLLLTNDDGFHSPLLALLCRAAAARGHRVTVCAPALPQSAKSHALTVHSPLCARSATMEGSAAAWQVEGTPADCARLGLRALVQEPVDLVISGINDGWNLGLLTYVSGTVAAAREAAFLGYPALAVSAGVDTPEETIRFLAEWAVRLGEQIPAAHLPPQTLVNVNIPACTIARLRAPRLCPVSTVYDRSGYARWDSDRGSFYVSGNLELNMDGLDPSSDDALIRQDHITVSLINPRPLDASLWSALLDEM